MIVLFEGVPGSGKSYYCVADRLLPWVRAGRRLYVRLNGFHYDRLSALTGIPEARLREQITLLETAEQIVTLYEFVEPNAAVVIDEAQNYFRGMTRLEPKLLRWLEAHRHYGVDVVLLAQRYTQLTSAVIRLVETTYYFKRLDFLGFTKKGLCWVRGTPEETEVIRRFPFSYDPTIYAYYDSYSNQSVVEQRKGESVWKSPFMIGTFVLLVIATIIVAYHPWITAPQAHVPAKSSAVSATSSRPSTSSLSSASKAPDMSLSPSTAPVEERPTRVIRIVGGGGETGQAWRYLLSTGAMLSAQELAATYSIRVQEVEVDGVRRVSGEGITYDRE